MSDVWRFSGVERIILFTVLFVQWSLLTLLTMVVLNEHGTVGADFASTFELFYWFILAGLALGTVVGPTARLAGRYAPKAYRYIKTTITQ